MNIRPLVFIALYSAMLCQAEQEESSNTKSITIATSSKTINIQSWKPVDLKKNDAAFENFEEIIKQGGNVIVDFYADWCNPCKMMMRTFDTAAKDHSMPELIILKVNIDDSSLTSIINRFSFNSIPALFYFKNGKQVKRSGSMSLADFKALIKQLYA